jgi:hypothetical protein
LIQACLVASDISGLDANLNVETKGCIEVEWIKFVDKTRRELKDTNFVGSYEQPVIIHSIAGYIGGVNELFAWAGKLYRYKDPRNEGGYGAVSSRFQGFANNAKRNYILHRSHYRYRKVISQFSLPRCFRYVQLVFRIPSSDQQTASLLIELYVFYYNYRLFIYIYIYIVPAFQRCQQLSENSRELHEFLRGLMHTLRSLGQVFLQVSIYRQGSK